MSLLNIRDDREAQRLDREKRQPDRRRVRGEGRGGDVTGYVSRCVLQSNPSLHSRNLGRKSTSHPLTLKRSKFI